jgi:hypothetical protein
MMKNKNKLAMIIFFVLVGFCVTYALIRVNDLKKNGIIVRGKILGTGFSAKSSVMLFDYEFQYNGRWFKNDSPSGVTNPEEFVGKMFPVYFSPKTDRSEILITPRHFGRYGLPYPDSLEWVRRYLIKTF